MAVAAGDWAAVAGGLSAVPPREVPPRLVPAFIAAALQLDSATYVRAAARAAIAADLRPLLRARLAWRLAFADHPDEAWLVLHADPAALADPGAYTAIVQLLARIAAAPHASGELRAAAEALGRRFAKRAAVTPARAPHAFAQGPAEPRPGHGPARIVPAPGVSPAIEHAYRRAIEGFEAALHQRPAPAVTELRDVFVNRLGQIWLASGEVVQDRSLGLPPASRAATAGAPSVPAAALAVEAHNSIYHWLADWLPSLAWRLEPGAPDVPVLIRDDAAAFVRESLRMAGGERLPVIGVGDALHVGRLLIGTCGAGSLAPLGAHRRLLEALQAAVDAVAEPPEGRPRRLYISRRDSTKRPMENEAAVEAALARLGFRAVTLTGRPLAEQARLLRGADLIAAPHGAGLVHLLFARPGTAVFEIMPGDPLAAALRSCMARLSRLLGHRHLIWLEARNPVTARWGANLPAMLPALEAFAEEARPLK
jgi:hypothetical protein